MNTSRTSRVKIRGKLRNHSILSASLASAVQSGLGRRMFVARLPALLSLAPRVGLTHGRYAKNSVLREQPELFPTHRVQSIMKSAFLPCAVALLIGLSAICGSVAAGPDPSNDEKSKDPKEVRTILEKGAASGSLPEDMVVYVRACLGEADAKGGGDREPDELREMWEFSSNQVSRVVLEFKDNKYSHQRVESRPFDSKGICKNLLDGKAIEIQARKGEGPEAAFVGTRYHRGSRSIAVEWKGHSILDLHETNGPFLDLYHESDARAFGILYEDLAAQAATAYKAK